MSKKVNVTHIVAEFYGCSENLLQKVDVVKDILEEAVDVSKLTKVKSYFHQFNPHGVTGVVLLKESHVSIHTWPEYRYAAVDIFGCGDRSKILAAFDVLVKKFNPSKIKRKEIKRGF